MSATLGTLLKQLEPDWDIRIFERLPALALESSNPWNNAGTGHSALCELNYTPERADGTIDITSAVKVNEQFQVSRQFWYDTAGQSIGITERYCPAGGSTMRHAVPAGPGRPGWMAACGSRPGT